MAVALIVSAVLATGAVRRREAVVAVRMQGAQLLPLLRGEDAADGKGHLCICLLKVGACGGDAVDGRQHGTLVGAIGCKQGFQFDLFLLQRGMDVNELHAAVLEDQLNLLHLSVIESDGLDHFGIFPPTTGRKNSVHLAARTAALELSRIAALEPAGTAESGTLAGTTLRRLRKGDGA